jgi:hypothetical protein
MVGTGALLHDMLVKKGLPCLAHREFKKVHLSIIMEVETPCCWVKLEVLPKTNQPWFQELLPLVGGEALLDQLLLKVCP